MVRNPPAWAEKLILDAILFCHEKGFASHNRLPDIVWKIPTEGRFNINKNKTIRVRRRGSSGVCFPDSILISAGSERRDCKLVILHEVAHWVMPLYERKHSKDFWKIAWALYRHFKLPIQYCRQREGEYKKNSIKYSRLPIL